MRNILRNQLKSIVVETLQHTRGFDCEEGNPFLMKLGSKRYFLYVKNISSAYFKHSSDVTRVQLPFRKEFSKIIKDEIPFVILGYDSDNDVLVCWNPEKIKERLNSKNNVSLYSRHTLQNKVKRLGITEGFLSNGEKIVLFKKKNLPEFFKVLPKVFIETRVGEKNGRTKGGSPEVTSTDKLFEIKDRELLQQIRPLLRKNKVLEAVRICSKFYNTKYKSMTFGDWFNLVKTEHSKVS